MRRMIRWVDDDDLVYLGVELRKDDEFEEVVDDVEPLDLLLGERVRLGKRVDVVDQETLELAADRLLITPIDAPEVWCAGVTYEQSRNARMLESAARNVYELAYDAPRPELFLKDAGGRRTMGPGEPIGIRADSTWNVPEAEIGLVLGKRGKIIGYTIGNDVSSRDIEGANPLYLSQAKVYAGACAIGPSIYVPRRKPKRFEIRLRIVDPKGKVVYDGKTTTERMVRSFDDLASWLVRDNPVPPGSILLTGTGLVPPDDFTLVPGQWVEIHVPEIGTLVNQVVIASDLL